MFKDVEEDVLSIADYMKAEDESYSEFYTRLVDHQSRHQVEGAACTLSASHLNLVCIMWLQKIHKKLPHIVRLRFGEQLKSGATFQNLVPVLIEEMNILLDLLRSTDNETLLLKEDPREPAELDAELGPNDDTDWTEEMLDSKYDVSSDMKEIQIFKTVDSTDSLEETDPVVEEIKLEIQPDECSVKPEEIKPESKVLRNRRIKKRSNEDDLYSCNKCEFSTNRLRNYRLHIRTMHEEEQFYCTKCSSLFDRRAEFREHRMSHRKEKRRIRENQCHQCSYCDLSFKKKETLRGHEFKVHRKGEGFGCDQCDYRTILEERLKQHVQSVHEGVKGSVCYQCGASYSRKGDLDKHIRVKHEGLRFLCDQCDFRTVQKDILKRHVKNMHGDKTFGCDQCDFKAACQLHLRNHMITIHENVQYYPCNLCDYNARRPVLLKEHKLSKHMGIRYSCKLCDHKATRKWHMKRHMIKIHSMSDDVDIEDPRP